MAGPRNNRKQRTLWSQSGPSPRLLFGAAIIAIVGVLGMTPKAFFGIPLAWPFAALWGAMGWGRVGLALRPMVLAGPSWLVKLSEPGGAAPYGVAIAAGALVALPQSVLLSGLGL